MLTAKPMTIRELFSGKDHYRLPRFQRHYAWNEDLAGKLLEDILEALPLETDEGKPRKYFLGAIITIPSFDNANKSLIRRRNDRNLDIIDGQQRLATLTILFSVLRDVLGGATAKTLQKLIEGASKSNPFRVRLRGEDEEIFANYVKTPGSTRQSTPSDINGDSIRNLLNNRDGFRGRLESLPDKETILPLLCDYLLDCCNVVKIVASEHDDAHQVYETLNQKGLPFSRSSHIKSTAFRGAAMDDVKIDAMAKEWDEWERKIGIERLDRLFSVIRAIHGNPAKPIVSENARIIKSVGGCKNYVDTILRPSVKAYLRIESAIDDDGDEHPEIRKYLVYMNWLNHTDWYGPVIKWFHLNPDDDEATIAFLKRLDRLAFGLLLKGETATKRRPRFKRVEKDISVTGQPVSGNAIELEKNEQERILFNVSNDFQDAAGRACKMLLIRISDVLGDTLTEVIPANLSIEHVLPRTINKQSDWRREFPDRDVRERSFARLANLVLLPSELNRSINRLDFSSKKEKIFFSEDGAPRDMEFTITNDLKKFESWTPEIIDNREDQLIDIVRDMWDLKGKAGRELDN